jgi:hexosaminidase
LIPPRLIPTPTRVVMGGGWVPTPAGAAEWIAGSPLCGPGPAWLREAVTGGWCGADARDGQAYTLRVRPPPGAGALIEVESPTALGLRHARATIAQLIRQYPARLPTLEVRDRPALATRGVMLDVSRCRIPTMAELRRVAHELAALKCNHLQVYTEHTFAYAGHEDAWRGWDPFTPAEVRELDSLCRSLGIELAANQNCFGHLRHWLELPAYAHLAETHGDWMFDVWPRSGPFSLCPTDPRSLEFVEGLLGRLLPCFSGPLVNIGCDEAYDIAYGRSAQAVRRHGRGRVYAAFVAQVALVARRLGKRPMFWADIALSHPECLSALPDDMIALAWGYEHDAPFERWCHALTDPQRESGPREAWVCPGTSSWRSIGGRRAERRGNIDAAAAAGVACGAPGMLICDWGDSGHWQTWPVAALGLADGLNAAWAGPGPPDLPAISLHVLGDAGWAAGGLAAWLDELGDLDLALRRETMPLSRPGVEGAIRNQSALFADLFKAWHEQRGVGSPHAFDTASGVLDGLREQVDPVLAGVDGSLLAAECRHTLECAAFALHRFGARRGWGDAAGLPSRLAAIESRHRELWLARSRPGGLEQSCAFFRTITTGP